MAETKRILAQEKEDATKSKDSIKCIHSVRGKYKHWNPKIIIFQDTDKQEARCHRVTDKSLHPITGNLKDRLTTNMMHLPVKATKKDSRCQLHYWAAKKKFRSNIVCITCNVTLCIRCYEHFHLVQDLVKSKSTLKKEIDNDGQV